jgi:hypothetical protein
LTRFSLNSPVFQPPPVRDTVSGIVIFPPGRLYALSLDFEFELPKLAGDLMIAK